MTRLILGALLVFALGCTSIQPVGVLAKKGAPDAKGKDKDDRPEPVVVPAVKPTPPMNLVDPMDVTADPRGSAQKLQSELEADSKTVSNAPVTAEVSHLKNGVKQN